MDAGYTLPNLNRESSDAVPVTLAFGDGIGPEIMSATLRILDAAGAKLKPEVIEVGEALFKSGFSSGIKPEAWESLRRTRLFLKSPVTTPQGGGLKSLNVTIRKTLGLYANIRPCRAYTPYVESKFPKMDLVIVRENEEDLYAGIEHRQTDQVYQCLKLVSQPGTEKIMRYAFEYAVANGRKKVTCMSKDNIMKLTDGLFHKVFDQIGAEYPDIQKEHWIIDIGMAKVASDPEAFDVIVTSNLYGDIISDVAAEVAGSVGMAGSANIGDHCAMFEAIHGSAPMIAGQNIANPSGLLSGAVQMLVHIGQSDVAEKVQNAWLKTLEDGQHTGDIYVEGQSKAKLGTQEFADAVIARLGQSPSFFTPAKYGEGKPLNLTLSNPEPAKKDTIGVDVFVGWRGSANDLAATLTKADSDVLKLKMITNRGVKVWPEGHEETFVTDHWRCRYQMEHSVSHAQIVALLSKLADLGVDFIKTENLCTFDGQVGFSLAQGQ